MVTKNFWALLTHNPSKLPIQFRFEIYDNCPALKENDVKLFVDLRCYHYDKRNVGSSYGKDNCDKKLALVQNILYLP